MQWPLWHWPLAVQAFPVGLGALVHTPPASQNRLWSAVDAQVGASSSPAATGEQVPRLLFRLQTLHVSLQSVSQQTPSAQWPLAQSVNVPHVLPRRALHTWLVSQAWSLAQLSSGEPA